ncbi:ubiquinol-cytochrome-c reductase complex subunit-domain-containing protein [Triangularia verruculosa]|uniref:Ubiquinol-cytochrome-c reductase complex subunit-domain-containing protein n=1 Tax=Triangularia verruculosa TaxID=2587418 RepID=A0AAN7AQE7_9PEZI|nr:ubiquinol-cytochrome-c reductase complex subunit-domain-containing protein [Triangularia verruculosa]
MPFPTPVRRAAYPEYKSPYGPRYQYQAHVGNITARTVTNFGVKAGFYGGVALFGVIFLTSGIPRVYNDVLGNIPVVGPSLQNFFDKKVHPADNPF